jgi:hypothetical protein
MVEGLISPLIPPERCARKIEGCGHFSKNSGGQIVMPSTHDDEPEAQNTGNQIHAPHRPCSHGATTRFLTAHITNCATFLTPAFL